VREGRALGKAQEIMVDNSHVIMDIAILEAAAILLVMVVQAALVVDIIKMNLQRENLHGGELSV
jgi:hypothetical protein